MNVNKFNKTSHIAALDMMRGIAALSVCFFHFTHNYSFYGDLLSNNDWLKIIGKFGWLGVQMFFVISGFIIPYTLFNNHYRIKNFFRFLSKRWLRIEPPYIVSIILLVIIGLYYHHSINWKQLFLHLFYLPQFFGVPWLNEIFWTLAIEFQFYIFMAFTFPFFVHSQKWVRYLMLILFASAYFAFTDDRLLTSFSSLFLTGIIVFMNRIKLLNVTETFIFILLCIIYSYFQFSVDSLPIAIVTLISTLMILFVNFNSSWGKFTGRISYSLYLTHGFIGHNIIMGSMHLNITKEHYPLRVIMVFIAIIGSVIFAWLFNKLIENPAQSLSKKISYR